jgi:hypothetical protein
MIAFGYPNNPQTVKHKGVIDLKEKKEFVEPKVVKCEESLDKVTLCGNNYDGTEPSNPFRGPHHGRR